MSADISDVGRIQDEDVLKKMWQETEDFGRKKEIRSHMYKLREARLKNFYNSEDVNTEIHRSTINTSSNQKTNMSTTHADSLADQSYVTLKSKEVRDSESPTRDSFNKSIAKHQDQGWNIDSSHERSIDGKTHTSKHTATTSGSQNIDGGKLDYVAKLEEKASVFQDGDDRNFSRAVGTSSNSMVHQEASGGDANSHFHSSSSKTSSSSRYVSESKSATESQKALPPTTTITREPYATTHDAHSRSVVENTFTTNIPSDLKNHPIYVEGKTKVSQETKTLADGTVVTTTRYETKDGSSTQTATTKKYSNVASSHSEQRSSSSRSEQQTTKNVMKNDRGTLEYVVEPGKVVDIEIKAINKADDLQLRRDTENITRQTKSTRVVQNEQRNIQNAVDVKENRKAIQNQVEYVDIPASQVTTTKTTRIVSEHPQERPANQSDKHQRPEYVEIPVDQFTTTRTTTTKTVSDHVPQTQTDTTYRTTSTHTINQAKDLRDSKRVDDQFISTERQHEVDTREHVTKTREPLKQSPKEPTEPYVQPDRRHPIKPGKSELDQKPSPTDGQYDTTYRNDFTSKKISVEVSATHDAFARSLRSITPERITRNSPRTTSNTSLPRSTTSPGKTYPSRSSPDRYGRSRSPRKSVDRFSSSETITYKTSKVPPLSRSPDRIYVDKENDTVSTRKTSKSDYYSTDTLTRKSKTTRGETVVDSSTLTRRKNQPRSPSPTGTASTDFEYVTSSQDVTTDLDEDTKVITREKSTKRDTRPSSLEITTRKVKKVTERSPTSPLTDIASPRRSPTKEKSPSKDTTFEKPKLLRTDTYEEHVKEILGLTKDAKETRRSSLEKNSLKRSSFRETKTRTTTEDDVSRKTTKTGSPDRRSPVKESPGQSRATPTGRTSDVPDKKSPGPKVSEFPNQSRKSPEKHIAGTYPEKKSPTKTSPTVSEFPSQIRKSPQKEKVEPYPQRMSPAKTAPTVSEFPSQIRQSPEKAVAYPDKKSPTKPSSDLPSLTQKSPQKAVSEHYPDHKLPSKCVPSVDEFPAQTRKSPEREPLKQYSEPKSPTKIASTICEFPSQSRKSPEREPLEPYPEKKSCLKTAPTISEFPSQIRKSPEKEPLEPYPEKKSPAKTPSTISEFPSQIKKSPEREPLEPYPEKKSLTKTSPKISEFPSQSRKSPQREVLERYPEKTSPTKIGPSISEFPAQARKSPEKEVLEPYPEKKIPTKSSTTISEYPGQKRKSPERQPLEPYPEKKSPVKTALTVSEFSSQGKKSPKKESLEPYPEKISPTKSVSRINEFPAQIRRSPERHPAEPYPEKVPTTKVAPTINEYPSQTRKSPTREPMEQQPEKSRIPNLSSTGPSPGQKAPSKSPDRAPSKSPERPREQLPKSKKHPTSSKKSPRKHLRSESSTSSESEDIEEVVTDQTIQYVENRVPIQEPVVEKKIFTQLCKADEVTRLNKKKTTQELIESEIVESARNSEDIRKSVKKDTPLTNGKESPKKPSVKKFTTTSEITKADVRLSSNIKEKAPVRKAPEKTPSKKVIDCCTISSCCQVTKKESPKSPNCPAKIPTLKKQPVTTYKVEKTKFIGATEYQHQFSKVNKITKEPTQKPLKPEKKTTLHDIERSAKLREDKSVHIRTNRVDETVTKKKVTKTVLVNGDANKPKPKESPVRLTNLTRRPANVSPNAKPVAEVKPKQTTATPSRYITKPVKDDKPKTTRLVEPKRHVVSTTITVSSKASPKTKPTTKSSVTTSKTAATTTKYRRDKVTNGYASDTDDDSVVESTEGSFIDLTDRREESSRTRDQTFKSTRSAPVRGLSKSDMDSDNEESTQRVITTKTVQITNEDTPDRDFIVNLQRSKSSREPTPDRLCPRPMTSDEEDEDSLPARYPDEISEPDDGSLRRRAKKLSDLPIFETEDISEVSRITDITDTKTKISKVDRVEATDESLLTINKKIDKFLNTAEQLTKEPIKSKASKVERPTFEVSDDLKEDECLLSVSDKVSRFINTADQLNTSSLPDRPKSPRPKAQDGVRANIQKKVTDFNVSVEETTLSKKRPASKVPRPDLDEVDETLKRDECMLSVSDKVSKFISTAEKLTSTTPPKKVSLSKIDIQPTLNEPTPSPTKSDRKSPEKNITKKLIETEKIQETNVRISPERSRSPSPGQKTPNRRPSNQYSSILHTESTERRYSPSDRFSPDSTPKSTRRPSQEEPNPKISSATRLRSTESIKKAKALFENVDSKETKWQKDILSRPSVFEGKKTAKTEKNFNVEDKEEITTKKLSLKKVTDDSGATRTTKVSETTSRRSQSPKKSPQRVASPERIQVKRFRSRSPDKIPDIIEPQPEIVSSKSRSREPTPDGDLPHYMKPLDRSLRPNSPHRDGSSPTKPQPVEQDARSTRFGVTLRRTDSGRTIKTTENSAITERRKSSIILEKRITEEEIEEIFELEVLEELLEKITGYELRRKIRTQIRLVKKLITEGTLEEYITKRKSVSREAITRRGSSPSKAPKPETTTSSTEYQSTYTRKVSPERKVVDSNKLYKHSGLVDRRRSSLETTTEYQSSYSHDERRSSTEITSVSRKSSSPQRTSSKTTEFLPSDKVTTTTTTENIPGGTRSTTTKTTERTFTTLKKTVPPAKAPMSASQPEWVRQRNLKNTRETAATTVKKSTNTSTSTSKKFTSRISPAKEIKGTDIITSSYGVGPTDENGTPLFGLKALRAQNKNEKTKVQGTVIRSEYYSENDQEPVGQVSVTKYSTDPRDLEQDGIIAVDGKVSSVTTTQKFGYKDTPSLKSLTDKKKEICDTTETSTTKTTKVNRRGSVKEISKKFIDNAVETLKSERQTTYPKAGLILRSSSFKSTNGEGELDSRESSPGAQVILSGMEGCAKSSTAKSSTSSPTSSVRRSTKITTTITDNRRVKNKNSKKQNNLFYTKYSYVTPDALKQLQCVGINERRISFCCRLKLYWIKMVIKMLYDFVAGLPFGFFLENGKPTVTTRVFQRPVTEKELQTVWDEQTLQLLLEQSTDYEERRVIRARLRQVMAEQEACTALVDEATKGEEPKTPTTPIVPGQLEGESQLLPLLQGLLDAPENDITPDSGTESGEDQRSSLIAEVQTALDKLSNSLKSDQTDITPERRSSLLQLVTKLQAGLSGGTGCERRSSTVSSGSRFQKRKNKQARHTVGVSKEELADARRLIEQISLNELTPSNSTGKLSLSKQNSESSVPTSSANSSYRSVPHKVKNAVAKPFSSSNSTSSSVHTPTEHLEGFDGIFNEEKESGSATPKPVLERNASVDSNVSIKSAYKAVQQAAASKVEALKRQKSKELPVEPSDSEEVEEEEEDESSTVKAASDLENAPLKSNPIYSKPLIDHEERCSRFDTQKKLKMKRANTIDIPKPLVFYEDEDDSESEDDGHRRRDSCQSLRGPLNVGNPHTKKIVPAFEPKTESDKKFMAFINKHNDNNANKGSIWSSNSSVWGSRFGNIKNTFENKSSQNPKSFWKTADDNIQKSNTNQFGPKISRRSARNLQQMFEKKQKEAKPLPRSRNVVQQQNHVAPLQHQNKPSQVQNRHLSQKSAQTAIQDIPVQHQQQQNVVTGVLQVKTPAEKHYRVVPQPLPVNQFSHAPQSAFVPIRRSSQSPLKRSSLVFSPEGKEILKSEIKENGGSSFLYSPKPMSSSVESSTVTSPVTSKPWVSVASSRVLSLAASKFEQPVQPVALRSRNRDVSSKATNQVSPNRASSYLPRTTVDSNSSVVRKLSGQYEDSHGKAPAQSKPQTYQVKTSVVESQYEKPHYEPNVRAAAPSMPLSPPQNYSIKYDRPQNYSVKYDQPKSVSSHNYSQYEGHQPQNFSIRYDQARPQNLPQNYSIRFDKPAKSENHLPPQQYQPQNYSIRYDQASKPASKPSSFSQAPSHPNPIYQQQQSVPEKPGVHETEYTSSCVFKPSQSKPAPVQVIEPLIQPPTIQRQISDDSVHEHKAVSSRVMSGPVGQQAVTVRQKSPMNRDQHDMAAAFSLKTSLQKVGRQDSNSQPAPVARPALTRSPVRSPSNSFSYKPREPLNRSPNLTQSFKYKSEVDAELNKYKPSDCPKPTVSPSSFKFKSTFEDMHREGKSCGVVKPMQQQKTVTKNEVNSSSKLSVVTGQFHIPVINVKSPESPRVPTQAQVLGKSDSWHEICMAHQTTNQKPAPKPGPVKSKSSNTLAVPKMFEAGMSKDEMTQKRKTMEAFLTGNTKSSSDAKMVKRSINRVKTSQKVSTQSRSGGGLIRSRTLPDMVCPELLDESNVERAFDELFECS
ncbi:hypothetical protein HUJ05_009941 [Dendroctonus ponderosae]|nr:hypothetical protein HUJ05_009941 [Dendroctonus ponderosae]KAH1025162.1 hypothetical protein HUJ05_009941 [Dendroctonus ponderosae]